MADTTDIKQTDAKEKGKKEDQKAEFNFALKPEERHGWEAFSHFVWNPDTKQFLGRTGMSWRKCYNLTLTVGYNMTTCNLQ